MINILGKEIAIKGKLIRIASLAADMYEFLEDPASTIDILRSSGVRIDLFTFMQRLPDTTPKYNFPMEWDNLAGLPLSTFNHWWTEQVNNKTRNMARKAEKKGIKLREVPFDEALVRGIWTIYNESSVRQGKPFAHYGKHIEAVRREAGTFLDRSFFIGAFLDETLVGFAKLICDETRTQAGLVHILSMIQHRDKAPTNALLAEAVRSCAARGIPYLVYSRFSDGNKQRDSLVEFKEHNGFRHFNVPRYYVPLTLAGRVALQFGLHRPFSERIPEPLLAKLREVRNAWYNRKPQSLTDAS